MSRYGIEQGVFPGYEEKFYEEYNQYGAGTFIYQAYGKIAGVHGRQWDM